MKPVLIKEIYSVGGFKQSLRNKTRFSFRTISASICVYKSLSYSTAVFGVLNNKISALKTTKQMFS